MATNPHFPFITALETVGKNSWIKDYYMNNKSPDSHADDAAEKRFFVPSDTSPYLRARLNRIPDVDFQKEYLNQYVPAEETFESMIASMLSDRVAEVKAELLKYLNMFLHLKGIRSDVEAAGLITCTVGEGEAPDFYTYKMGADEEEFILSIVLDPIEPLDLKRSFREQRLSSVTHTITLGKWYIPPPKFDVSIFDK